MANTNFLNITVSLLLNPEATLESKSWSTLVDMHEDISNNTITQVSVDGMQVHAKCPDWYGVVAKCLQNIWSRVVDLKIPANIVLDELKEWFTQDDLIAELKSYSEDGELLADVTNTHNIKWMLIDGTLVWEILKK